MTEPDTTDTCKRCGSSWVKWVKSARTGRAYLAFAVSATTRSPMRVYRHLPHDCADPLRGGIEPGQP
ncbi:hypothetical protein QN355_06360 [Cryobacterium sp. 10S3]|uniref:hypothetical protein n=1 Tax=Cryobacterium sp. 10S3 TaxID=3048582 RepID=UPI002AC8D351|nr:hypothetical protein [Cryobacterium sp. 10S3]MEB0286171.1 hypothetical protein [Cryobacterium sp. 10S3]WPX12229.1 hypothetical protein RHM57_11100 [Cryobacterium sp. 10S3]